MAIRIGYKASAEQFGPRQLLSYALEAEARGFDSVAVSDHFQPFRHTGGHAPAALPWLGALAVQSERIRFGTSVSTPTLRVHPSIMAQSFATIASLAPGRVWLGVGTGESMNEVPALGIAWPRFAERLERLAEAVELMRLLWSQDRVTYDGTYYRTANATVYDKPDRPVPILIAAAGAKAARFAGAEGDGYITTSGKPRELYTETLLPKVAEGIAAGGPKAQPYDHMIEVKVSFDTDKERALQDTRHWAALALSSEEKMSVEDPVEMQRLADALPLERAASRWIVSSDPDEQVEKIGYYVGLGFNHLVFHAPGPDQARFLDLYGKEVLPRLRKRFG